MRYYVVLDMPDSLYPATEPFYAIDGGDDPLGRISLATYIDCSLDEEGAEPTDITVYTDLADLIEEHA